MVTQWEVCGIVSSVMVCSVIVHGQCDSVMVVGEVNSIKRCWRGRGKGNMSNLPIGTNLT